MKKLNSIFALAFSAAIVLSSCSQQRYSSRAKVRVNDQAKEQQQKEAPKELAVITPKQFDVPAPEVKVPQAAQAQKSESAVPAPTKREVLKKLRSKEMRTALTEIAKEPKQIQQLIQKEDNVKKEEFKEKVGADFSSKWVKLFIIGLVILLIGIILPGGIGSVFYLVGGLIMLIALILFLLELV